MRNTLLLLMVSVLFTATAQMPGNNKDMMKAMKDIRGRVYGKLVDAATKKPIEYGTVVVLWYNKDSLIGGGLTDDKGEFSIDNLPAMGGFRLKATQIGYIPMIMKFYIQPPNKLEQDLGDLKLEVDEKMLAEVDVVTEKNAVVMSIDKRTYNVDKDLSVKGGTGVDVMKNVPGVTVDADGNVQLRNQSPMLFVDGRPTNLTLQQIPADQIDRVEIITNPSVKFDASATGGILNVIMKKNLKPGYNGMAMGYAGTGDRYGGMLNVNVKEGRLNFTGMYSYNQAFNQTNGYTNRQQLDTSSLFRFFNQNNDTRMRSRFNFGRFGLDYALNNRSTLTLTQMIMSGNFKTHDEQQFDVQDKESVVLLNGTRINEQWVEFHNYNTQLQYRKTYATPGKELTGDLNFNHSYSQNGYLFTTYAPVNVYQRNQGHSNASQFVAQMDYVNPISETRKLEAGFKSFYKTSVSGNNAANALANQDNYATDTLMSNRYLIDDMINAAYMNYSSKTIWNIGYQAGLRFEQSYYKGNITDKNQSFSYQYPSGGSDILKSVFPAIYFSKKLSGNQEWQFNVSRKIQRPNFFQLMPFVMFADRQNYRIGNPELRPEFRNIAELNYNKILGKGSYLGSGYFRYEEQPITDVAYPSLGDPTVLVNTSINGRNSVRYGMEHTMKYTLLKNLDLTGNFNVFYIYIKGLIVPTEPEVETKGFAYNAKLIAAYKFPKQLTLQVNGNYESPRIMLLGASLPIYFMDISVNKMFGTKWILNATVSDVFNTKRMGAHYETPYYIQDLSRRREPRYFRLSVTYLFGKMDASIFKRARQLRGTDTQQGNQDGLDFGR